MCTLDAQADFADKRYVFSLKSRNDGFKVLPVLKLVPNRSLQSISQVYILGCSLVPGDEQFRR